MTGLHTLIPPHRENVCSWRDRLARLRPFAWPVGIMTGLYALGISAILRANFNYIDDMGRVFEGYRGWSKENRYLSSLFSIFLHADTYLSDTSPLPQLISCLLLAATSVIVLYLITGRKRFTVWEYAAVLPLGLSPCMLECLSYKFDAPYFAVSVLASVAPLLAIDFPKLLFLTSAAGTLVMCNTYQASSGVLPMFTVVLALRMWLRKDSGKRIIQMIIAAAAGFLTAIVFYRLFLAAPKQNYYDISLPPAAQFFPSVAVNYKTAFSFFLSDYSPLWLLLLGLLTAAFVYTSVHECERRRPCALLMTFAAIIVLLLLSFGAYPLMSQAFFRPRTLYGAGILFAFLGVCAASSKKLFPGKLVCLGLAWCFFVFAFTYGNALSSQKDYTDFRIQEVIGSIEAADAFSPDASSAPIIQIKGSIGFAPALQNVVERFPILAQLVPVQFGDSSWSWSYYGFSKYYDLPEMIFSSDYDLTNFHLPVLDETVYHTIYGNEQFMLIELK